MTASRPRVSIVIPVFNGADYLREAIESALAQTYDDFEVLVVDDGSRDGGATEAVARSYADRIRYVRKDNGGVSSALNAGIREMRGEYFSWLSHDDLFPPEKLALQMAVLPRLSAPAVLYGDYELVDGAGNVLGIRRVSDGGLPMRAALIARDMVNGCTTLIPRACFERVGLFDETLRTFQDYDMWFRLAKAYPFVHVPEILLRSRLHAAQGSRTISTHFAECSAQMIRLLEQLEPGELRTAHVGPPSSIYARIALAVKLRGYDEVAQVALALSRRHSAEDDLVARAHRALVALGCAVLTKKMKPSYRWSRTRPRRGRVRRP